MRHYCVRFGVLHRVYDIWPGVSRDGKLFAVVHLVHGASATVAYKSIKTSQKEAWDWYNSHQDDPWGLQDKDWS